MRAIAAQYSRFFGIDTIPSTYSQWDKQSIDPLMLASMQYQYQH